MTIHFVLLIALGIVIFLGVRYKKLALSALLVCGTFGLLLGATGVGRGINGFILGLSGQFSSSLVAWLQ